MSGNHWDKKTAGGGLIQLNLESVNIKKRQDQPSIEANGYP